ncbi:TRAP transporter small permease subunit [Leucothrix pacifica]|nr:TRAP transporter small permease subunit [Leucothrix pacifica]
MTINSVPKSRRFWRSAAAVMAVAVLLFLFSRYLMFWLEVPGVDALIGHFGEEQATLETSQLLQTAGFIVFCIVVCGYLLRKVKSTPDVTLQKDSEKYARWAAYIVRAAFWSIFLVGIVDGVISFLRIENLLTPMVGETMSQNLDQARWRGTFVHYPIIALSMVIAWFSRSLGFIWLAFLVVIAEFGIVLSSFIFSYEQAFMGDLVRFWYAGLFLFASAYTLVEGGHVRVDVLYAGLHRRTKAWVNTIGCLLLGLPLCWTILTLGMDTKQSSLISPIYNFEMSQSGYGMYVKYLMASFLVVFAASMAFQFISYLLNNIAIITNEPGSEALEGGEE